MTICLYLDLCHYRML